LVASRGGRLEQALAWGGGELIRLPVDARTPWAIAANGARLARIIRERNVRLVHVRSRAPAFSALWAARRTGTPIVATYHGIYTAKSSLKRWYNSVMTRGDAVIANSAFTCEYIRRQHRGAERRLALIPEGIDVQLFDPAAVARERVAAVREAWGVTREETAIVLVGRLTGWKGHAVAIEALGKVKDRERVKLVFVGRGAGGPLAAQLARQAGEAGVALVIAGECADMPAAYMAANLVIAPSTEPESFGRAIAEAGAMSRLVLASDLGGAAEIVDDRRTGFLVKAGVVRAWTNAFDRALRLEPGERAVLELAAWARVRERYSLERMREATFDLYRRLCEEAAP
jgi:glycosyltransferase involved in cell wall biosynthesis